MLQWRVRCVHVFFLVFGALVSACSDECELTIGQATEGLANGTLEVEIPG
ncbi:MAG: hypothetical protein JSW55_04100 [Chloroflexota bacterium]|nr:MAG: hypothetical protein JSW55_04100 [Chloroflexota bacterium]